MAIQWKTVWLAVVLMWSPMGTLIAQAAPLAAPQQAVWVDVRTPWEFARGHLPGAVNIPLSEIGQRIGSVTVDKNTPLILYCHSGRRSGAAQKILWDLGYTRVENKGTHQYLRQQQGVP